ncbi:MAG TPA: ABC transporter ATP-binding protein [Solirubrobacteraceae bacterium]
MAEVSATAPAMAGVARPAELEVRGVTKDYGGLRAVDGVSLTARPGEVLGVAGPNGAGKTTLFDVITGLSAATDGDVLLGGVSLRRASVHARCHRGLARTFQHPTVADTLTVFENVALGGRFGRPHQHWHGVDDDPDAHAAWLLELVGLTPEAHLRAGPLGVFDKKCVMLASALATGPRVLLLDEPFGGLDPDEIEATLELLQGVRDLGVAVVCIEHVMSALVRLATRVVVMDHGSVLFEGSPREMLASQAVIDRYLGMGPAGESRLRRP